MAKNRNLVKRLAPKWNKLRNRKIEKSSHDSPQEGTCIMEAIAYITDQPFSDEPVCVAPTLRDTFIIINDNIDDDKLRNRLKKFVPQIMETRGTKVDDEHWDRRYTPEQRKAEGKRKRFLRDNPITEYTGEYDEKSGSYSKIYWDRLEQLLEIN